jgi:hypothetical protein
MGCRPWLEVLLALVDVGLTVPAVYEEFSDDFPTSHWESYFK